MLDSTFLEGQVENAPGLSRDLPTEARAWVVHTLGWNSGDLRIFRLRGFQEDQCLVQTASDAALVDLTDPLEPSIMRIPRQMELQQQKQLLDAYSEGARTAPEDLAAERRGNRGQAS